MTPDVDTVIGKERMKRRCATDGDTKSKRYQGDISTTIEPIIATIRTSQRLVKPCSIGISVDVEKVQLLYKKENQRVNSQILA